MATAHGYDMRLDASCVVRRSRPRPPSDVNGANRRAALSLNDYCEQLYGYSYVVVVVSTTRTLTQVHMYILLTGILNNLNIRRQGCGQHAAAEQGPWLVVSAITQPRETAELDS